MVPGSYPLFDHVQTEPCCDGASTAVAKNQRTHMMMSMTDGKGYNCLVTQEKGVSPKSSSPSDLPRIGLPHLQTNSMYHCNKYEYHNKYITYGKWPVCS